MTVIVKYESNNSGGSWWLKDEDWEALDNAGWNVHWSQADELKFRKDAEETPWSTYDFDRILVPFPRGDHRWLGGLAKSAAKEFPSIADAVTEWQTITGQDPAEEGCNCCGPPHSFQYRDEDGETHYSSVNVVATEMSWS